MNKPLLSQIGIEGNCASTPGSTTSYGSQQSDSWGDQDVGSLTSASKKKYFFKKTLTLKKRFPSGYLDRKVARTQTTTKYRRSESILPLLASLRTDSAIEDVRETSTSIITASLNEQIGRLRSDSIKRHLTHDTPDSVKDHLVKFHATSSAPALFTEDRGAVLIGQLNRSKIKQKDTTTPKLIKVALLGFLVYIIIGIFLFVFMGSMFKGERTHKVIDALYFSVVTLCTIGYGDIVPATTFAKLFTSFFMLFGFGFIDILLQVLLTYVLDQQQEVLLGAMDKNKLNKMIRKYIIDEEKGRMRIRLKVCLALGVVVLCLATGTITAHFLEKLTWVDSFYLSVTSVTTVGYGDYSFTTAAGRCFAIFWLLASTLAVARAFLYLIEYRIERRNRKVANVVLHRKLTPGDLAAADMDHDGSVSKPEYVIFKLKEMGMIEEKDIREICKEFELMDGSRTGKITIADVHWR